MNTRSGDNEFLDTDLLDGAPAALAERVDQRTAELLAAHGALAALRRHTGHSQAELAASLNVTQPAVAQLETRDLDAIQIGTLHRLLHSLGLHGDLVISDPANGHTWHIPITNPTAA